MEKQVLKTLLTKKMIEQSFYGLLGLLPDATLEEIENSFRRKVQEELSFNEITSLLKAYSILTSSYKQQYDDYLNREIEGISIIIEEFQSNEELINSLKNTDDNVLPDGVFMQPWATSI